MEKRWASRVLLGAFWTGWRRRVAWLACIAIILLLGVLRTATDAEFTVASLELLPVLFIAWIAGTRGALFLAMLAVAVWVAGDIVLGRQFSAPWIPWANAATRLMTFGLVAFLADQVRVQLERAHRYATQDALTGLQNRRAFLDAGSGEVDRSKRYAHPLAVVFLDLDAFKRLNDTLGHEAGDIALQATARALRSALRSSDRVARLGGDEFAAILPEIEYDAAVEAGRKISVAVNRALQDFPPVTASIGLAWFGEVDRSFPAMLKAADDLMYEVKESGKNGMRSRRFPDDESACH